MGLRSTSDIDGMCSRMDSLLDYVREDGRKSPRREAVDQRKVGLPGTVEEMEQDDRVYNWDRAYVGKK